MYINSQGMIELFHLSSLYTTTRYVFTVVCLLTLVGCGSSDDEPALPLPPHIAGEWSGTWEGIDSTFGPAFGTWEATISQSGTEVKGPMSFGGDIDCAEGKMTGIADAESEIVSGNVFRDPCPFNTWVFTAFNEEENSASGLWEKPGLSLGSFEGQRIAKFTGPHIEYVYPPGARAGAYVTIVGERLTMDLANDSLTLGPTGADLVPITADDTIIRLQLPGNITASEQLVLTTAAGKALSPRPFNTNVVTPNIGFTRNILLSTPNLLPTGIAFSINNRRAIIANRGDGSVRMINLEKGVETRSTIVLPGPTPAIPVHAVVVDPDGRKVYAAGDDVVGVLHAHTLELLRTITVPANGSGQPNPQGIAVSPDGRWLLVSEAIDGGSVTILDVDNNFATADTLVMAAGNTPRGIATSPDNIHAYIAVSGSNNEIWVYDLTSAMVDSKIVGGTSPAAIAVTPDAKRLYVTNAPADTINYYGLGTGGSGEIDLGAGVSPTGLAISPDGFKVFVTSSTNSIYVIDVLSDQVTPVDVGGVSSGVTISRDGKRAYVTLPADNKVVEIGGQRILQISKQGGGIGEVTTSPAGILCGNSCIATFDAGVGVRLIAIPDSGSNSTFSGWSGDADCGDGFVTMNSNLVCVANFKPPPSSGGGGSGSSDCFIATAAYGAWLDPHVLTLREFRDHHLLTNMAGTWLVEYYYRHSPPIADYIRERDSLRAIVRSVLAVIIYAVEYPIAAGLMLLLPLLISVRQRRQRSITRGSLSISESQATN